MSAPSDAKTGVSIQHHADGRVGQITIHNGKGNIVDKACIAELREAFAALAAEPALCALILSAEGRHFSFGASVEEHLPGQVEEMLPSFHALAREVLTTDIFLIAAVQGSCLGGGLELALLADRIVATADASLGQPEVVLGVFAPLGSALLPRRVPSPLATDLLASGRVLSGEEGLAAGLVQEVAADPLEAALAWCSEHLVGKSAAALRHAVHAARLPWRDAALADLATLESIYLGPLQSSADACEGIEAFIARRPAVWKDE